VGLKRRLQVLLLQVFVNNVNKIVRTRTCQGNLLIINNKAFVGRDRQLPEKYLSFIGPERGGFSVIFPEVMIFSEGLFPGKYYAESP
jgi:hypothetical protein